jgi:hypothetical protein
VLVVFPKYFSFICYTWDGPEVVLNTIFYGTLKTTIKHFHFYLYFSFMNEKFDGETVSEKNSIYFMMAMSDVQFGCIAGNRSSVLFVFPSHKIIVSLIYLIEKTVVNQV